MRLIADPEVRFRASAAVFGQSTRAAALGVLLLATLAAGAWLLGAAGLLPRGLALLTAVVLLLFGLVAVVMLRRARSPGNWLLACDGGRALINLRSYLNAGLPADEPHVLELPLAEIASARRVRVEIEGGREAEARHREVVELLELELREGGDVGPLRARLERERTLRGRGATWRHYPVTLAGERTIRIEWRSRHARVVPGVARALDLLATAVAIAAPAEERIDTARGPGAGGTTDTAERVRALTEQGRLLDAASLAREAWGMSLTEARAYVERISAGESGQSGEG